MGLVILDDLPELKIAEGILLRVVTADSMTVAHVKITSGALLPEHSHPNEQVVNVIDGELEMVVDRQSYNLTPGKVMVIPPDIVHSGRGECRLPLHRQGDRQQNSSTNNLHHPSHHICLYKIHFRGLHKNNLQQNSYQA